MRSAFLIFHYGADAARMALIDELGLFQENSATLIAQAPAGETVTEADSRAWLQSRMAQADVAVVFIGQYTANSYWVHEEIKAAFDAGLPLVGVHIHSVVPQGMEAMLMGQNPFEAVAAANPKYAAVAKAPVFDPTARDHLGRIAIAQTHRNVNQHLGAWVELAESPATLKEKARNQRQKGSFLRRIFSR